MHEVDKNKWILSFNGSFTMLPNKINIYTTRLPFDPTNFHPNLM